MNEQSKKSLDSIKGLSVAERILIVEDIWDSIVFSNEEIPISDEQKNELEMRLENYYKNRDGLKMWDEVKKEIQSNL